MPTLNEKTDAYIEKSADFAKPILTHLRQLVHSAIPEVTETIKWGMPFFEHNGLLCHMASFKQHCAFGFSKCDQLTDKYQLFVQGEGSAMSSFGKIKSFDDLPDDSIIIEYLLEAAELNKNLKKSGSKPKPAEKKEVDIPDYFLEALNHNPAARQTFENFSPSNRKDYVSWITEAKTETTREKRLETALEWMAEGKSRHWKYQKK